MSGVRGIAFMSGWTASGNRSDEKKMPDSSHIGSITRFIRPETASIVLARLATSRPMPANMTAPSTIEHVSVKTLPWLIDAERIACK